MTSMWIRRGLAVTALVVAGVAGAIVLLPGIRDGVAGTPGIRDAETLPEHIGVCGRGWTKDSLHRILSLAQIRVRDGVEAVVVDPGPFAPCPVGPCGMTAQDGPCHTVIYVRVGQDAYIDYALQGGP
jgi:hypothetical protein